MSAASPLLAVDRLTVTFGKGTQAVTAVRGVSFALSPGRTLCLVGESGSGKSVSAMAILGLLPPRSAHVEADRIALEGSSLLGLSSAQFSKIRGGVVSMIFQDPMTSLNPALTVGFQIVEAIRLHERLSNRAARARAIEMLERVRIPDATRRFRSYPHQMSGGMRQRVMIAMALACRPKVLIADEPTTALDVTVQAQILSLMDELKREFNTAVLLITHDLGVVAEMADEVAVMYAGRIVEQGPVSEIFDRPAHGYTLGLLSARPENDSGTAGRLNEIPGSVPRLSQLPKGCTFAPRCVHAIAQCTEAEPPVVEVSRGHLSACIRYGSLPRPQAHRRLEQANA